jgi:hypothetical protein
MIGYRIFVGKPEEYRPLGREEDNTKMDLTIRETGWGVVWTRFIWLRIGTSGGLL